MTSGLVLVIEDNETNADVLRENLIESGYVFALAVNGAAGVAVANNLLPDIILMDINLPILDGLSATRLLKKNTSTQGIPIIALTARAMVEDRELCLEAGCDDYVSKPINMEVLFAKLQHHLARRSSNYVAMIQRLRSERDLEHIGLIDMQGVPPEAGDDSALVEARAQIAQLALERDALQGEAGTLQGEVQRLQKGMAQIAGQRDELIRTHNALIAKHQALQAQVQDTSAKTQNLDRRAVDELAHASNRNRKLTLKLEAAREQIQDLQSQITAVPGDLLTLQVRHESLRAAFLKLREQITRAAEEAMQEIAFGKD